MNRPRTENVVIAITFIAGLTVAAWIPSPYRETTGLAKTTPVSSTETADDDQSLPDLTVIEVDVRRLAQTGTII